MLNQKPNKEDDYIKQWDIFEIKKQIILIEVSYCKTNIIETSKGFPKKL